MSFNNKIINKKNKGLTLVEALIVLAVFAGVVAIALNLYNTVTRNSQVSEETTNLSSVYQSIDNFFRRGSTDGLDNQVAINAGFIPSGMSVDAPTIYTAFNGEVEILGVLGGTDNKAFTIEYSRVPATACSAFVQGQSRVGWDKVAVAANDDPTVFGGDHTTGLYFRTSDDGSTRGQEVLGEIEVIALCNDAITGDYVNIIFGKDSGS